MKLGEVYYWETDRAIGHARRDKFHVYLCAGNFRCSDHVFLFISKGDYGGDYCIFKDDYDFLTYDYSYVSCNGIVSYSQAEVDRFLEYDPDPVGRLKRAHVQELRTSLYDSETMENWQISLACGAITSVIGP